MAIEQMHTYCAMCVSHCGVMATVEDGIFTNVQPDPEHPNGCICVKGTAAPEIVYSPDRLQYPMKRTRPKGDRDPGWVRISWEEAMAMAASRLLDIKARYGAEAVVFGIGTPSGTATVDYWEWLLRLANAFGSPNFTDPIYICAVEFAPRLALYLRRDAALTGLRSRPLHFAVGHEPPGVVASRRRAYQPGQSARCQAYRHRPAQDEHGREGGPLAPSPARKRWRSCSGMIHVLLEEKLYDERFVRQWTNGPFLVRTDTHRLLTAQDLSLSGSPDTFVVWDGRSGGPVGDHTNHEDGRDSVEPALIGAFPVTLANGKVVECRPAFELLKELAAHYAPERSEAITWTPAGDVRRAVRMFATERPSCFFSWTGLEQHSDATQTNRAVDLFYALTGQFDQCGSNVLFASAPTNLVMGPELLPPEQAARRLGIAEHPLGPSSLPGNVPAYEIYRAILTGDPYPVKALVTFGSDLLLGRGDPLRGKAALEALDFHMHVDMFCNPSATFADLLLPACTCWEREALLPSYVALQLSEDTTTWVQLRPRVIPPLYESRSEMEIIFDLAKRLGVGEHFFNGDIEAAFNHQLAPSGLTVQQLREHPMGMRFEAQTRYQKYAEIDPQTGQPQGFRTPTRKIEIYSTTFAKAGYDPLPVYQEPVESPASHPDATQEYPLVLTFFRVVQFCDEQHRNIPRLRRPVPEPFLEIHPHTAIAVGITDSEWVVLETATGRVKLKAKFRDSLHPQVVATQYGWWQGCKELGRPGYDPFGPNGANANLLVPNEAIDPIGGSVPHRSQRCRVRKESVSVETVP